MKLYSVLFLILCIVIFAKAATRVNCIGASITYGATLNNPATQFDVH